MNDRVFRYRYKGMVIEGYGCERIARSEDNPGGMIDKKLTAAPGFWRVVPLDQVTTEELT